MAVPSWWSNRRNAKEGNKKSFISVSYVDRIGIQWAGKLFARYIKHDIITSLHSYRLIDTLISYEYGAHGRSKLRTNTKTCHTIRDIGWRRWFGDDRCRTATVRRPSLWQLCRLWQRRGEPTGRLFLEWEATSVPGPPPHPGDGPLRLSAVWHFPPTARVSWLCKYSNTLSLHTYSEPLNNLFVIRQGYHATDRT